MIRLSKRAIPSKNGKKEGCRAKPTGLDPLLNPDLHRVWRRLLRTIVSHGREQRDRSRAGQGCSSEAVEIGDLAGPDLVVSDVTLW